MSLEEVERCLGALSEKWPFLNKSFFLRPSFFSISSKASGASCLLYFVKADDGFDLRLDQFWASLRVSGDVGAPHLNVGLS